MSDARRAAAEETAAMVAAIHKRGGTATALEISTESGFPLAVVRLRLVRNGPSMMRAESRYFRREGEAWGLTDVGLALVATS